MQSPIKLPTNDTLTSIQAPKYPSRYRACHRLMKVLNEFIPECTFGESL